MPPSITVWNRIEPQSRDGTLASGVAARIHDPLWLLARQWQLGEFRGEDGGSVIQARLRAEHAVLSRFTPGRPTGTTTGDPFDPAAAPLEAVVEREPPGAPVGAAFAAEAGLHLARMLGAAGLGKDADAYLADHALRPPTAQQAADASDPDGLRYVATLAGRVIDGAELYGLLSHALATTGSLPPTPQLSDPAKVQSVIVKWLAWCDGLRGTWASGAGTWEPERAEHTFAVQANDDTGGTTLVAEAYPGGHLDWHAFDVLPNTDLGARQDAGSLPIVRTVVPTPASFPGMPLPRFWAMEDADVHVGGIEAAAEDVGRLALAEFALVYGNDFFVIPVELPVGALCRTRSLVVTDTFGHRTLIAPTHGLGTAWRMYALALDRTAPATAKPPGVFFLPPALGRSDEGPVVEDVAFLRDEMANMAWAVERRVPGLDGRARDRAEAGALANAARAAALDAGPTNAEDPVETLRYRLATQVPGHWFPLVTVDTGNGDTALELRGMLVPPATTGGTPATTAPSGVLLGELAGGRIPEEEIPRQGLHVTRGFQRARWLGGSTHLWQGRQARPGRGEGSSGLRFDVAEPDLPPS